MEKELLHRFGYSAFRSGQKEVIERIMTGSSAAAIFPTGAGKSLCYQLPATLLNGLTLVVSPLLSLMYDQLEFLQKHNIPSATLDSTLSREEYQQTLQNAVNGSLKVLMISVERFKNERFRSYLSQMKISLLVVDEAHCISEWGHNFRPEYLKLPHYVKEFHIPQVLLLTATATDKVAAHMCEKLDISMENCIRTGFYRENLFLQVTPVTEEGKEALLISRLKERGPRATIVYVTLQKTADEIAKKVHTAGFSVSAYHAGMNSDDRAEIQRAFMSGEVAIVVATIAFGMGIDKSDIGQVIHYDLPKSIENYSQEIGRAGRDGSKAICEVFANGDGITVLENFVYGDTPDLHSLRTLLTEIANAQEQWEMKLYSLSNDTNIRQLPLKTVLVYLEMEGLITPLYSYFADYQFKTDLSGVEILSRFKGEQRSFLQSLFSFTEKKKVWVTVKVDEFLEKTGAERSRAIAALEYLDAHNMIELSTKQAIELYRIEKSGFDVESLAQKLESHFKEKEQTEINRIGTMIRLFESSNCLSTNLAWYFGEKKKGFQCGHCSVCKGQIGTMKHSRQLTPIHTLNCANYINGFKEKLGNFATLECATRFFCGIAVPQFTRLKMRSQPGFGLCENYPYAEVREHVRLFM